MRILGIDPGTGITGFGVIDVKDRSLQMVDAGVIRTRANQHLPIRLSTIFADLQDIIKQHRPEVGVVEKLFFARNVTTAISVSQARGVVLLALQNGGVRIEELTPLQVKRTLTGYGRADKKQIQAMVQKILNLKSPPKPDDCADALALAICQAMTLNIDL